MLGSLTEWILILSNLVLFAFIIGKEYQSNKTKNDKVDAHDKELKDLDVKIKAVSDRLHTLGNSFNAFKQTNEVKTSIVLMLLFQVCKANNIDTNMAQFILDTDTPDGLKDHKK